MILSKKNLKKFLSSVPPCLRGERSRGFTLIEILSALAVLMIGLSSVIAVLYGSANEGRTASDRNAATILIPEALRQIELDYLITDSMDPNLGMLIQTLSNAPESDKKVPYKDVMAEGLRLSQFSATTPPNLNEWPRSVPKLIGELPYRVRYRLEKHPDWVSHDPDGGNEVENPASLYRGMYVLTLICYLDNERDMSRPVQVSEPVVAYLRDRKTR